MPRSSRGGGQSTPPYPFKHSGPCLVVGNAFCLEDDLRQARELFPGAPIVAVNGAAWEVRAFALFTIHPQNYAACRWIQKQRRLHTGFTTHSTVDHADVQHVWPGAAGGGGSAWAARKMAAFMGFSPVVLCGCPLVAGNYSGHRPGILMAKANVVGDLRAGIESETEWHEGAKSMSGWTREVLGSP